MEQLFSQYDLTNALRNQEEELKQAVEKLRRNEVLAVSEGDLVDHLVSRFSALAASNPERARWTRAMTTPA